MGESQRVAGGWRDCDDLGIRPSCFVREGVQCGAAAGSSDVLVVEIDEQRQQALGAILQQIIPQPAIGVEP